MLIKYQTIKDIAADFAIGALGAALILIASMCGDYSTPANEPCQDGYSPNDAGTCVLDDNIPRDSEGNPIDPTCPVEADQVQSKTVRFVDGCTGLPLAPAPLLDIAVSDRALQRVTPDPSTRAFHLLMRSCVFYSICVSRIDDEPGQTRICWESPAEAFPSDGDYPILFRTCP